MELRVCTSCVMDTTDPHIEFDAAGVCDQCRNYFERVETEYSANILEDKFRPIAESLSKNLKGREFNCLIGLSGGLDSSYLLHKMVTEYGLRPLVFHVDAGWNTSEAVGNIEKLIDKLDLQLYTEVINWREMRDLQLSFFKSGVAHLDVPQDHCFISTLYHFATKFKIPVIFNGGNYSTEGIRNPLSWLYYGSDRRQISDIQRQFGTIELNQYPLTNVLWHKVYLNYVKRIRVVKPLNMIPYSKTDAENELKNTYGWQNYPQKHFESRFTRFFEGYWLPERFGYDTRKPQFSSLVVSGQMNRDEAMEKLKSPALAEEFAMEEFDYVADKLQISSDELHSYLIAPKKYYTDYANSDKLFNFGSRAMQMMGIEKAAKR